MFTFTPFMDEHLLGAAQILADRHRKERIELRDLPERFEHPGAAEEVVEKVWARPDASGWAAIQGGRLVAYLLGESSSDPILGRNVWIPMGAHAVADGISPEILRDLYMRAAEQWVKMGCLDHYVVASVSNRSVLDAWHSLSFGWQQAYGLMQTIAHPDAPEHMIDEGITLRKATARDRNAFSEMALMTAEHQVGAPVWAPLPAEIAAARPAQYGAVLDDDEAVVWLATRDTQVISFQVYYPVEPAALELHVPPHCAELCAAATRPEWRNRGIARRLFQEAIAELCAMGYRYCVTDWRTTNLLSSRVWPRLGFTPVAYRLHRRIDRRIC